MSQQANPLKIGIFVLAGIAIAVGGLLVLGSGRLFARPVPVIVYFQSSVNGLTVGAPVKFKGVPVGQVKRIQIAFDEDSIRQAIPVLLELDEERIVSATTQQLDLDDRAFMRRQVNNGLRASLELDSFISGRLYVQLDYIEDAPLPELRQPSDLYFEIPSVSTGLQEFMASLSQTDLAGLALDLRALVQSMNEMITDFEVATIRAELVETLNTLQELLRTPDLTNALHSVSLASDEARLFLHTTQPQIGTLTSNVVSFTQQSSATLAQLRRNLQQLESVLGHDSVLLAQIQETLRDLGEASGSIRRLADNIQRNPSSLVTGRDTAHSIPTPAPSP
jgi:paraquat-inducible protein B